MKSPDPASLQNLNDIVLPATLNWWPLAGGWYVLIGFLLIALTWLSFRFLRHWKANGYRRTALQELQFLEAHINQSAERDATLKKVPALLKRTALSAYPRRHVASLSGEKWIEFLNSTVKNPSFTKATASTLNVVSYSAGELHSVDTKAAMALLGASRSWLKDHQPIARPRESGDT